MPQEPKAPPHHRSKCISVGFDSMYLRDGKARMRVSSPTSLSNTSLWRELSSHLTSAIREQEAEITLWLLEHMLSRHWLGWKALLYPKGPTCQIQNVILILTKLYDYNLGSITESSLWRSTDYGTTYEKLNDKVGLKTILSYLYVCPTNKRKIMLLTDPEIESSLLISSDEGATYQKYRLNFYIQSLLFHPKQEDWILAYSQDQKLYSSAEFGRRWQLIQEGVVPNRFYWSVMGSNKEPDLVHLEARTVDGHSQYLTCRMQNCTEANRNKPFPGYIDPDSLIVQDDYVFVQLTSGGRPHYYVSYRRNTFAQMKLPKYALPKDMHVISTDENQVFAAVQEWNQNDTYNLYISDTRGVYFTLALENVQSSRGPEGNVMIDLYEVAGIKGMFLANKKIDNQVKTFITYNKGRDWRLLQAPDTDLRGDPVHCLLPYCSLHLHLKVSENPYTSGIIASRDTAPSIIVASGNIGSELSDSDISMFVSSDAGNTWRQIFEEEHSVLYLDQGGVLVAMKHTSLPGLPTAAELFVLPYQDPTGENKRSAEDLEQISELLIHKLNQNSVHFELKPGVQVLVHAAHLTAAPLVDLTPTHSGSAMLMLLSVVFVGLAVFVIYKFKRKIPGINVYAQMQNEKEREMVSRVSHPESRPHIPQTELRRPGQLIDEKVESQLIGE